MVLPLDSGITPPGLAKLEVSLVSGQSTVTMAYATSPLKLLTPCARAKSVWAYTGSFGGGLLGGDQTQLQVRIGAGARCFLSTQASTKVYRNRGGLPCSHQTHALLEKDALLVFAPDKVQPFAGSSYSQRQKWRLDHGAGLVLLDWFSSGRAARGERWQFSGFQSRNDVFIADERVFTDSLFLDGADEALHLPHRTGRFDCFAMLLFIGPSCRGFASALLETMSHEPVLRRGAMVCSASPLPHGAILRIAGECPEDVGREVERHLQPLSGVLGDNPWKRKW